MRRRVKVSQPLEPCPTCGHAHPSGVGVSMCGCRDCFILFGPVPVVHMAPEYQEKYKALRALMAEAQR